MVGGCLRAACPKPPETLDVAVFRVQEIRGMATAVTCDICDINIIISACPKAKLKLSLQVHLGCISDVWTVRRNRDCSDCEIEWPQGWDLDCYGGMLWVMSYEWVLSFLLVFFEHSVSNIFHCRQAKSGEIIMSPKQPDELHSTILVRSPRTRTSQVSWQNRRLFRGLFKLKISKHLKIPWSGWPRRRWYQKQIHSTAWGGEKFGSFPGGNCTSACRGPKGVSFGIILTKFVFSHLWKFELLEGACAKCLETSWGTILWLRTRIPCAYL